MSDLPASVVALRAAIDEASRGLVERESLVELIALSAVAGEHVLLLGPPGTGKSEAARRAAAALGLRTFEYLLGRFTEPSEIFGPVDLRRLREGEVVTETSGMLPEAELAFLDEVFLGSTAILNALLTLLNERTFRRGKTAITCPLRVCVGASNTLPDDEGLLAFADRFLLRAFVRPLGDPRLEELLEQGATRAARPSTTVTAADLDRLTRAASEIEHAAVRGALAHALRRLRHEGIELSDRRMVKAQRVIAAATVLAGRTTASEADLWPLVFVVPTEDGQRAAREALGDVLARTENRALPAAAEEASLGPLARATRIVTAARALLAIDAPIEPPLGPHRLRLEALLREIDAGFAADGMPAELSEVRTSLADAVKRCATP